VEAVFNKVGEAEVDNRERRVDRDGDLGDKGPSIEDRAFEARQAYEKQRKQYADFAAPLRSGGTASHSPNVGRNNRSPKNCWRPPLPG